MGMSVTRTLEAGQDFPTAYKAFIDRHPTLTPAGDHAYARYHRTVALLREHCPPGGLVADVGAWPGILTGCLRRLGWRVVAVDKAPARATDLGADSLLGAAADASAPTFDGVCRAEDVEVVRADIETERLPFEPGSLDAVVLTEVIEHLWSDPVFALAEVNRVLRPETGCLLLSTPNLLSLRNRVNFLLGRIDRVIENPFVAFLKKRRVGHLGHVRLYAPAELRTMLRLLGFEPTILFDRFHQLDHRGAPAAPGPSDGEGAGAGAGRSPPAPSRARRLLGKLVRSPRGYWNAANATLLQLLEYGIARFRPQIYVVARKVAEADLDPGRSAELEQLVLTNTIAK